MVSSRKVKDCEKDEMLFIVQICLNKKNELDQIFPRKLRTDNWLFIEWKIIWEMNQMQIDKLSDIKYR